MSCVVFAGLDLNGQNCCTGVVVNQKIYLSALFVVIVEKLVTVSLEFLCDDAFIDGAEVDAVFI